MTLHNLPFSMKSRRFRRFYGHSCISMFNRMSLSCDKQKQKISFIFVGWNVFPSSNGWMIQVLLCIFSFYRSFYFRFHFFFLFLLFCENDKKQVQRSKCLREKDREIEWEWEWERKIKWEMFSVSFCAMAVDEIVFIKLWKCWARTKDVNVKCH